MPTRRGYVQCGQPREPRRAISAATNMATGPSSMVLTLPIRLPRRKARRSLRQRPTKSTRSPAKAWSRIGATRPSAHFFPRMWNTSNERREVETYKRFGHVTATTSRPWPTISNISATTRRTGCSPLFHVEFRRQTKRSGRLRQSP